MKIFYFIAGFFTMTLFAVTSPGKDFIAQVEEKLSSTKNAGYCTLYNKSPKMVKDLMEPSNIQKLECTKRSISSKINNITN